MRLILLLMACIGVLQGCTSLDDKIKDLGYVPVVFPSGEYGPGQVKQIQADPKGKNRFQGTPLCGYGDFAGTLHIASVPGANIGATQTLGGTFDVSANYLDQIKASLGGHTVRTVKLELKNVRIESVSIADINNNIDSQNPGCTTGIINEKSSGHGNDLGLILQALKADGLFTIDFNADANLTADVAKEMLKGVAAKFNAGPQAVSSNSIDGHDLYFGVMLARTDQVVTPTLVKKADITGTWSAPTPSLSSVPCNNDFPCSSDQKWKAAETTLSVTATKAGRTLRDIKVECDDSGTGACVFQNPPVITNSSSSATVIATTFSIPVRLRIRASEFGPPMEQ